MKCITRGVLRWGLIGGLALAGTTIVLGPERVAAGYSQARAKVLNVFDSKVSDPIVLRRQLASLSEQYPDRIAEVRGELAEVEHQLRQYEKDMEVARRVVEMTTDDLKRIKTLVTRAEKEAESNARPVAVRFDGVRYNIEQAYTEARRINNVRATYQDRLAHDQQQVKFLQEQHRRLSEILDQLETEYNTFQAQLWQLDRQIDAIERNDRLIELTEKQQATLEEYERFGRVGNLKQLEGKLAQLRAVQEAQLQTLEKRGINRDYEGRAKFELDVDNVRLEDPFRNLPAVIGDDDGDEESEEKQREHDERRSMVWNSPIVIE